MCLIYLLLSQQRPGLNSVQPERFSFSATSSTSCRTFSSTTLSSSTITFPLWSLSCSWTRLWLSICIISPDSFSPSSFSTGSAFLPSSLGWAPFWWFSTNSYPCATEPAPWTPRKSSISSWEILGTLSCTNLKIDICWRGTRKQNPSSHFKRWNDFIGLKDMRVQLDCFFLRKPFYRVDTS